MLKKCLHITKNNKIIKSKIAFNTFKTKLVKKLRDLDNTSRLGSKRIKQKIKSFGNQ